MARHLLRRSAAPGGRSGGSGGGAVICRARGAAQKTVTGTKAVSCEELVLRSRRYGNNQGPRIKSRDEKGRGGGKAPKGRGGGKAPKGRGGGKA